MNILRPKRLAPILAIAALHSAAAKSPIQTEIDLSRVFTNFAFGAHFAVARAGESQIPEGRETFGGGRGTHSDHGVLSSLTLKWKGDGVQGKVSFPAESFEDLNNPHVLESPTMLKSDGEHITIYFSGGSGEKYYTVTYTWNYRTDILSRLVERPLFGAWDSQWKKTSRRWITTKKLTRQRDD